MAHILHRGTITGLCTYGKWCESPRESDGFFRVIPPNIFLLEQKCISMMAFVSTLFPARYYTQQNAIAPKRGNEINMEITNQSGDITAISPESPQQPVSLFRQININVFWLANQFHWNALIAIVIPSMLAKLLDPAQQDINLPLVIAWGTFAAVIVNPLAGAISDYVTFRMGRRRPFMIIGTIF